MTRRIDTPITYAHALMALAGLMIQPIHAVKPSQSRTNNIISSWIDSSQPPSPSAVINQVATTLDVTQSEAPTAQQQVDGTDHQSSQESEIVSSLEHMDHKDAGKQDQVDLIEFNFENAGLEQVIAYVAEVFDYTFIQPETVEPLAANEKKIKGNVVSFKTNRSLTQQEAWNLFVTFLDMSGFAITPYDGKPATFRIVSKEAALRMPIPTFIGVDINKIPEQLIKSDQIIRYVYFIQNSSVDNLQPLLSQLKSVTSEIIGLKEHNAFMLIDKAYNIASLMQIVRELDRVSMPQAMSVLKLKRASATEVQKLYESLIKPDDKSPAPNRLLQRKQPTSLYFPENIKILAEPRTNALILLGPPDAIKKIEDFVIEHVDTELNKAYSPLFVHQLKYADAQTIANIMTEVTKYGKDSEDGKKIREVGGLRGNDKFFKPMEFIPEKLTNRLVIKGDYEDYLKIVDIINQLDEPQPQVAIEILLLSLNISELKILGTQLRKKVCGTDSGIFNSDVAYQTSGSFTGSGNTAQGIVQNTNGSGVERLLGNLINLVTATAAGNTIISLGDSLGAWMLIQALEGLTSSQILANPFLLVTNNTTAKEEVGIIQRAIASTVIPAAGVPQSTFTDIPAQLTVEVKPLINSDGMITLDLAVKIQSFIGAFNPDFVQIFNREVKTSVVVSDKELIAIGGLLRNQTSDTQTQLPVLSDVPLLGWLFKNKNKQDTKDDLLILVSTQVIQPHVGQKMNDFTRRRITSYDSNVSDLYSASMQQDPINRFFFEDKKNGTDSLFKNFIFDRHGVTKEGRKQRREKRRELAKKQSSSPATAATPSTGAAS